MKKFYILLASVLLLGGSAKAAEIEGFFHIRTAAGQYMNVTGPFTANANLEADKLMTSPGAVFHVTATKGEYSYALSNLGAQGIDLAKDEFEPGEDGYSSLLSDALSANDIIYGMVHRGYKYGYTSVARATLATVFQFVAGRLDGYGNYVGDDYVKEEFAAVTEDFMKNVIGNLDMQLRLRPVVGSDNEWYIYVDMPDFQDVVDWYADPDATIDVNGTTVNRHDSFTRATKAMNKWLLGEKMDFMIFGPSDITTFKEWGFDVTKADGVKLQTLDEPEKIGDTEYNELYTYTFDKVFANKDFLFNWVKLLAYRLLKEDPDNFYRNAMGNYGDKFEDIATLMQEHTITSLIYQQLDYFQPNTRIYFVAGNVLNGVYSDENKHLGFALGKNAVDYAAVNVAGDYGKWILEPIQEGGNVFEVESTAHTLVEEGQLFNYSAYCFDFPVAASATKGDLKLYTIGEVKQDPDLLNQTHTYITLEELAGASRGEAFVAKFTEPSAFALNYGKANAYSREVLPEQPVPVEPGMSLPVSDEVVGVQRVVARAAEAATPTLRGTLLNTSTSNLKDYWQTNEDQKVYSFGKTEPYVTDDQEQVTDHVGFTQSKATTVAANSAVIAVPTSSAAFSPVDTDRVLIAKPEYKALTPTGIENVIADQDETKVIYDLFGRKVANPQHGSIYIVNGEKKVCK